MQPIGISLIFLYQEYNVYSNRNNMKRYYILAVNNNACMRLILKLKN